MEGYKNGKRKTENGKRVMYVILLVGLLCGCGNKYQYIPKDIEPVAVEIVRFDSALLAVRTDSAMRDVVRLYADYEAFMPLYIEGVLRLPMADTAYFSEQLANFLVDTTLGFAQTNALAKERFANVDSLQEALNTGFSRLHYLYPEWEIPTVYLFVSLGTGNIENMTYYYKETMLSMKSVPKINITLLQVSCWYTPSVRHRTLRDVQPFCRW